LATNGGTRNGNVAAFRRKLSNALTRDFRGATPLRALEVTGSRDHLTVKINIDVPEGAAAVTPNLNIINVLFYPRTLARLTALIALQSHVKVTRIKIRIQAADNHGQCDIYNADGFLLDDLKDPVPSTPKPKPVPYQDLDRAGQRKRVQEIVEPDQGRENG